MDAELRTPDMREIAGRGLVGGATGGAVIGGVVLMLGSIGSVGLGPALLAAPLGAIGGCVLGLVIGGISGVCLAAARRRVVGHDWCARRLAFSTSAAPFLVCLPKAGAAAWVWLAGAAIAGVAGAVLAPWVVRGAAEDRSRWS